MARTSTKESLADRDAPADQAISLGPLTTFIGYHLRLAQEASFQAFMQRVGSAELKPGRYTILILIHANPGLTPTALSRACGRDKSTLTPALRDLARRGLIRRRRMAKDQRSQRLYLTPAGEGVLQELHAHAQAHDRELDRIAGAKKAELISLLRRIAIALAAHD